MADFNKYIDSFDYSELISFITQNGIRKEYLKGELFSNVNQICLEFGFVEDGVFRYSAYSTNGKKHIVGFVFEKSFVCDYVSLSLIRPSAIEIEALTNCSVYTITQSQLANYYTNNNEKLTKAKQIVEILFAEAYTRYIDLYIKSTEERYCELIARCPQIFNLISLKELASYLNIRPETLSRIRKKIVGK